MTAILSEIKSAAFLEPSQIIQQFRLEQGDHVADFGAGHGYFVLPVARAVGGDGKVYAIDIQKPVLEVIRTKARLEHILNVELVWGDLEVPGGSHLKDRFLDFVIISNLLFQVERKDVVFTEAWRVLREGGRTAVLEWDETQSPLGPPPEHRVRKESVKRYAADAGFSFEKELSAGSHHYGLLFQKKS